MQLWPLAEVQSSSKGSPLPGSLSEHWPIGKENGLFQRNPGEALHWGVQKKCRLSQQPLIGPRTKSSKSFAAMHVAIHVAIQLAKAHSIRKKLWIKEFQLNKL